MNKIGLIVLISIIMWNFILVTHIICKYYQKKNNYTQSFQEYQIDGYDGQKLINATVFYNNDTTGKFQLSDIKETKLVLRLSGNHCVDCIDFAIKKIQNNLHDSIVKKRVVFLCTNLDPRIRNGYYGINTLNIKDNLPVLGLDSLNTPYLLVIDSNLTSKHIFFPDKSIPATTDNYLELVKAKYF